MVSGGATMRDKTRRFAVLAFADARVPETEEHLSSLAPTLRAPSPEPNETARTNIEKAEGFDRGETESRQ
jgi:hypothetical protein